MAPSVQVTKIFTYDKDLINLCLQHIIMLFLRKIITNILTLSSLYFSCIICHNIVRFLCERERSLFTPVL